MSFLLCAVRFVVSPGLSQSPFSAPIVADAELKFQRKFSDLELNLLNASVLAAAGAGQAATFRGVGDAAPYGGTEIFRSFDALFASDVQDLSTPLRSLKMTRRRPLR